jgi:thiamine biosynthesis protein ThiI
VEEVRGQRCVLLKFGELALKGRNRPLFVNALERNLRRLTSDLGPLEVRHRGGVFIVTGRATQEALVERCLALPGASVVQPALRCERDAAAAAHAALALLRGPAARSRSARAAATSASRSARSSSRA